MNSCAAMQERMSEARGNARPDGALALHLQSCDACAAAFRGLAVVDRALDGLSHAAYPDVPPFAELSARGAAAARGLRRRARLRKLLPVFALVGSSLAAALLAGALTIRRQRPTGVTVGDLLEASHGAKSAVLPSGAHLLLESGRLSIGGGGKEERLRLESGALSVQVPPLPPGALLAVETPDGEVVAHGTRFRVDRSAEVTRVALSEGKVVVRSRGEGRPDVTLLPGESPLIEPLDNYRQRQRAAAQGDLYRGRRL